MYDLIVIGGGPAGTSAAITSARRGLRVLLLDRSHFPRHKVCGEFVSAESLDLLATLLSAPHTALLQNAVRITQARIFVDTRELRVPVEAAAASIARWELDVALWQSAQESGVETKAQITVQAIRGAGPFVVTSSDGEDETRAVINSSGRWSNLSSAAPHAGTTKWLGLKAHFAETGPPGSVDLYLFEGGYCGVQPVALHGDTNGRVNACAMVRADVASTLGDVLTKHPALKKRSTDWRPLSDPVSTSPLIFQKPQPVRNDICMAGDAAGFVDPFVGDGISLALRSGALAAQCLAPFLAGQISLSHALTDYQREYERELALVFRVASKLRRMMTLPRGLRSALVAMLENAPAVTRYLVRKTR